MSYIPAPQKPTPWLVPLCGTVIIGYTDIAAAGSRALLGLRGTKEVLYFEIPDVSKAAPCCWTKPTKKPPVQSMRRGKGPVEKPLAPFMVYNCKFKQYSLVIINTHLSSGTGYAVAKYLADSFSDSFVHKVFILSALRLDHLDRRSHQEMFENTWNGMCPGTEFPELPKYMKIFDPVLCDMIQMFLIEGIPFSVLSLPGHRADSGNATEMDGSYEVISAIQSCVRDITELSFSLQTSAELALVTCLDKISMHMMMLDTVLTESRCFILLWSSTGFYGMSLTASYPVVAFLVVVAAAAAVVVVVAAAVVVVVVVVVVAAAAAVVVVVVAAVAVVVVVVVVLVVVAAVVVAVVVVVVVVVIAVVVVEVVVAEVALVVVEVVAAAAVRNCEKI
ncbi:hypothetical protein ElyMa_000322200 [Elysia marginata]|uniref:Proteasome assembly chaperone 1 n=1 Tax=Elysia marginata TaxID=1093978 RepID=A0AAV4FCQ4_9GAST|nr:hypothetical protein ElyMa_000322200 [Elysia marginata]